MNSKDSRALIFEKLKKTTSGFENRAVLPDYDSDITVSKVKVAGNDRWEVFSRNFKAVNGKPISDIAELISFLKSNHQVVGYCDPALYDQIGSQLVSAGLEVETTYDRSKFEHYQFGITKGTGLIAESGTVILNDYQTSSRLAALSPWVHIAVVTKEEIHLTIGDALAALGDCPNVIWCTGPSKTADVEGILIEGVHGPGEQIAFLTELN